MNPVSGSEGPKKQPEENQQPPVSESWLGRGVRIIGDGLGWVGGLFSSAPAAKIDVPIPKRYQPATSTTDSAEWIKQTHQTRKERGLPPQGPPEDQAPLMKKIRKLSRGDVSGSIGGLYLSTNETNVENVMAELAKRTQVEEGCHIGFSGLHNFDIIALRKSSWGIIADFNPENRDLINTALYCVRKAKTRQDFVTVFAPYVDEYTSPFMISPNLNPDVDYLSAQEELEAQLMRPGSWLASDESYAHLRKLALDDHICAIVEDVRDTKTFERIATILSDNAGPIDTLYLSNIAGYMASDEDKQKFADSVRALTRPESSIITCVAVPYISPSIGRDIRLDQQLFTAQELYEKTKIFFKDTK